MKNLLYISIFIAISLFADINSGIVSYYNFNSNANDSSGNLYHGVYNNFTNGKYDNCATFNGTNNSIEVSSISGESNQTLTITAWIYLTGTTTRTVLMKGSYGYGVAINDSGKLIYWIDGTQVNAKQSSATIPTNQWVHIGVVVDDTKDILTFYINGLKDSTHSGVAIDTKNGESLYIGKQGSCDCNYFSGNIDELRIYNSALSSLDIRELALYYPNITHYKDISLNSLRKFKNISLGDNHTVAIGEDGTLWSWGINSSGQLGDETTISKNYPVRIGSDSDWNKTSSRNHHTLAIKNDGTLWAWGINSNGQLGDGTNTNKTSPTKIGTDSDWIDISAGENFTLALKSNGTLWAWGINSGNQLGDGTTTSKNVPTQIGVDTNWRYISAGATHSFAIKNDNTLWGWGANGAYQLGGDGTNVSKTVPTQIGVASDWKMISAGGEYSMAVKTNGELFGWGTNYYGRLGFGDENARNSPTKRGTATNWKSVSTHTYHIFAIREDGTIWASGSNTSGQLGNGEDVEKNTTTIQVGNENNWSEIKVSSGHTAGLKSDGTLWLWGHNSNGKLGDGTSTKSNLPILIGAISTINGTNSNDNLVGSEFSEIINGSLGDDIINGLEGNDTAIFSGNKSNYILTKNSNGTYTITGSDGVDTLQNIEYISFDDIKNIDINSNDKHLKYKFGSKWTISDNGEYISINDWNISNAQVEDIESNVTIPTNATIQVYDSSNSLKLSGNLADGDYVRVVAENSEIRDYKFYGVIPQVKGGDNFSLILKNGKLYSVGANSYGQLGHGNSLNQNSPKHIEVTGENNITAIATGCYFSLILDKDGKVYGFGNNQYGQLGQGNTTSLNIPTQIMIENNITAIEAGCYNSLLLAKDGKVYSIGDGSVGQLGIGIEENRTVPTQILEAGEGNITAISTARQHSLMLDKDNKVYVFGNGGYGKLGLGGDYSNRLSPTQILSAGENNITAIGVGELHSFLIDKQERVYSFGYNLSGELGLGDTTLKNIPTQITTIGENNISSISNGGGSFLLILDKDKKLYGTGLNSYGQLGLGDYANRNSFSQISEAKENNITILGKGREHSLIIDKNGSVYSFGKGLNSQLGHCDDLNRTVPTQIGYQDGCFVRDFSPYLTNFNLSNTNLNELNITNIQLVGLDLNSSNFSLSQTFINGDNNISSYSPNLDKSFALKFDINGSKYWYNFDDFKLYSDRTPTSDFLVSNLINQTLTIYFANLQIVNINPKVWNIGSLKTGQTTSYINYDDGYYKKGLDRNFSRANEIVIDNITGLMWRDDINSSTTTTNWSDANLTCENMFFYGYDDWRLPSVEELFTIIDLNSSHVNSNPIFENKTSNYWSITSYLPNTDRAWYMSNGFIISADSYKTDNKSFRCVRGDSNQTILLSRDNIKGTILDDITKLMWQDSSDVNESKRDFNSSINYCENLVYAEYSDWRLPNRFELQTIVNYNNAMPSIDETKFNYTKSDIYWTSTYYDLNQSQTIGIKFDAGKSVNEDKNLQYYTRCVRDDTPTIFFNFVDFNISELNVTNVIIFGVDKNYTIHNLDLANNLNYTIEIDKFDENFSFKIETKKAEILNSWFYNFSDNKLYPEINSSINFQSEINSTNRVFNINLNYNDFVYYKFGGNVVENDNNITTLILSTTINSVIIDYELNLNSTNFEFNLSSFGNYSLKLIKDNNLTFYYDFVSGDIYETAITSYTNITESNLSADFNLSNLKFITLSSSSNSSIGESSSSSFSSEFISSQSSSSSSLSSSSFSNESSSSTSINSSSNSSSSINTAPILEQNFTNIIKDINFDEFNISLHGINDFNYDELNITVETDINSIVTITPNWSNPLNHDSYYNKDLNFTVSPIFNSFGNVKINIFISDGEFIISKEFNITINQLISSSSSSSYSSSSTITSSSSSSIFSSSSSSSYYYEPIYQEPIYPMTDTNIITEDTSVVIVPINGIVSTEIDGSKKVTTTTRVNNLVIDIITNINLAGNINTDILIKSDDGNSYKTTIEIPKGSKTEYQNDSIIQSFKNSTIKTSSLNGESNIEYKEIGSSVKITTPIGTKVSLNSDGDIVTKTEFKDFSPESLVELSINSDDNIKKVLINSKNINYSVSYSDIKDLEISYTKDSDGEYRYVNAKFQTDKKYTLFQKVNNNRDTWFGNRIEILPRGIYAKFEEIQELNGKRVVKLIDGSASIDYYDNLLEMEIGKEYLLPPSMEFDDNNQTNNINMEPIFKDNILNLKDGWNLVAVPLNQEIFKRENIDELEISWLYKDDEWIRNPLVLVKGYGFWLKMANNFNIKFEGKKYLPNFEKLKSGWSMIGTGDTLVNIQKKENLEVVWLYVNGDWIKNPAYIYEGQGFWILKR